MGLVPRWITNVGIRSCYSTSHLGQLNLAILLQVGTLSSGNDHGQQLRRNGEFSVTVTAGPAIRTACTLAESVNPFNASCSKLLLFEEFSAPERQSARMSKIKNGGLDQYGTV